MNGHEGLAQRLRDAAPSVVPYLTGGYPNMESFMRHLDSFTAIAPVVEVGIPFSDPMADGTTIQESSQAALKSGATLGGILDALDRRRMQADTPLVAMTYINPLLAFGLPEVMVRLAAAGVAALVIPDLPHEESGFVAAAADTHSVGLVQLVTPLTPVDRLRKLCAASQGFVYAVTMTGTTGGAVVDLASVTSYLDLVRSMSEVPVLAGFGIRDADQVRELVGHCDGVVVGSAIVEVIATGGNPARFLEGLAS